MSAPDLIRRAARSLRNATARTLLTALAIAVGTFALTLTLAASNGASSYASKIINDNFNPAALFVAKDESAIGPGGSSKPQEYSSSFGTITGGAGFTRQVNQLTDDDIAALQRIKGVAEVQTASSLNALYITRPGLRKYVATLQAYSTAQRPELLAGTLNGNLGERQLIVPEGFLSALGFKDSREAVGKEVTVAVRKQAAAAQQLSGLTAGAQAAGQSSDDGITREQFTIKAVTKKPTSLIATNELAMFTASSDVSRLNDFATEGTQNHHKYLSVQAIVKDGDNKANVAAVQQRIKDKGYSAQSIEDTQKALNQIISVLQGIVAAFSFIAIVASLFGVINTMYVSVLQRTREIGLMKALGMHGRDVAWLFQIEAALIGLLGSAMGAALAIAGGLLLNPWISQKIGIGSQQLLIFRPEQIILIIIGLVFIATLAGVLPALKAAKLDPIEALRTE